VIHLIKKCYFLVNVKIFIRNIHSNVIILFIEGMYFGNNFQTPLKVNFCTTRDHGFQVASALPNLRRIFGREGFNETLNKMTIYHNTCVNLVLVELGLNMTI